MPAAKLSCLAYIVGTENQWELRCWRTSSICTNMFALRYAAHIYCCHTAFDKHTAIIGCIVVPMFMHEAVQADQITSWDKHEFEHRREHHNCFQKPFCSNTASNDSYISLVCSPVNTHFNGAAYHGAVLTIHLLPLHLT